MKPTPELNATKLLRVQDVSERLCVSVRMVHRLVAAGALPRVKIGSATRFKASDVQALIDRQTS